MHSTLTALIDITDNWYLNIDNGLTNAILFIDLKKAFDTIDHEILLSKLELYEFKHASLNLFQDYLSNRTQVTVINNVIVISLKLIAYVAGCPKAQSSAPCYSYCTLMTFQTVTSYQM